MAEEDLNRLKNEEGGLSQERLPDELKKDIWEVLEASEHFSPEESTWCKQEELWNDEQEDIWKPLSQEANVIQRLDKLKSESWEFIPPWTLHAHGDKYDYCLFNLPWWLQPGKWFCLNNFFQDINQVWNKNNYLIDLILSIYCDNFLGFWEFYADNCRIKDPQVDSKIKSMVSNMVYPNWDYKLDFHDIRCWLAHNVSYKNKWDKKLVYIEVDRGGTHKEAYIEPSFFDEVFQLLSSYSHLSFDVIEKSNQWEIINYYTFKHKWRSDPNKWNNVKDSSQFMEKISKDYTKDKRNIEEIRNMEKLLKSQNLEISWNTLWLVSETNRPYVNNLFSIVSITVCYNMLKNPNIKYEELMSNTVNELSNSLFTVQDKSDLVTFCFKHLKNRLKVRSLKRYYVDIGKFGQGQELAVLTRRGRWCRTITGTNITNLSSSNQKRLKDIIDKYEQNNHERVVLPQPGDQRPSERFKNFEECQEEYNKEIKEKTHIRNALVHQHYFIVWDCIKMWDINKKGKLQRWSTIDGKIPSDNQNHPENEGVFSISELFRKLHTQDKLFESKEDRSAFKSPKIP